MKRLRRFAIIGIVVLPLSGCAATNPSTSPPAPRCLTVSTNPTTFCLSAAEIALGQTIVHDPTVPDSVMMLGVGTLTIGPHDRSAITQSQAEASAVTASDHSGLLTHAVARSAVLAEEHDDDGNPAHGQLVWIVDVTPPGGSPPEPCGGFGACNQPPKSQRYTIEVVNASTGVAVGEYES